MRKLYLVPIIHSGADMGSVATALSEKGAAAVGKELWRRHEETVAGFWESIAKFFESMEVRGHKVYQDGLLADGENGLRIASEGAKRGSANFKILVGLVERGAILVKTEDIALVKKEHSYIVALAAARLPAEQEAAALKYKAAQPALLEDRDRFIARTIDATMAEESSGDLFIGASHRILGRLPADIRVVQVKDIEKVREYYALLIGRSNGDRAQRLRDLALYLASPVAIS